jgi:hypothetical protein
MTYKVGQVLFVIPTGKTALIPVLIVEEITKKTVQGTITSYMVSAKTGEGDKIVELTKIPGEFFESSTQARKVMLERAAQAVNAIVDKSIKLSQVQFPSGFEEKVVDDNVLEAKEMLAPSSSGEGAVVLIDGQPVRVRMPDSLKSG